MISTFWILDVFHTHANVNRGKYEYTEVRQKSSFVKLLTILRSKLMGAKGNTLCVGKDSVLKILNVVDTLLIHGFSTETFLKNQYQKPRTALSSVLGPVALHSKENCFYHTDRHVCYLRDFEVKLSEMLTKSLSFTRWKQIKTTAKAKLKQIKVIWSVLREKLYKEFIANIVWLQAH